MPLDKSGRDYHVLKRGFRDFSSKNDKRTKRQTSMVLQQNEQAELLSAYTQFMLCWLVYRTVFNDKTETGKRRGIHTQLSFPKRGHRCCYMHEFE